MKPEIKIRKWNRETDYPAALQWWKNHGVPEKNIPVPDFLPRAGFVVESADGRPLCMGWLYVFLDVAGAQLGYLVSNPDNDFGESSAGLKVLIEEANRIADEQGWRLCARYTRETILNVLKDCGWQELVRDQVEMIRFPEVKL